MSEYYPIFEKKPEEFYLYGTLIGVCVVMVAQLSRAFYEHLIYFHGRARWDTLEFGSFFHCATIESFLRMLRQDGLCQ